MTKLLLSAALCVAAFSGCGSVCDRLNAANTKVFGSASTCVYMEGSLTITATRLDGAKCDMALSKCNASDNKALENYASCIEKAPSCASNAKDASEALAACALTTVVGLSGECASNFK